MTEYWQSDTRQPSFRPELGATWRTCSRSFGSYLPTVWLASCLIRLNCFFILCVSALPPDSRAASRRSLIERSQISALIYGRRQGSVLKHPVSGNIDAKSPPFLLMGAAYRSQPLRSGASKMLDRFLSFSPLRLTAHWRHDVSDRCIMGNEVKRDLHLALVCVSDISLKIQFSAYWEICSFCGSLIIN